MPAITVVIPVHNRAGTVGRAIRSILSQTFQNFEIVIVDDGSSDGSAMAAQAIGDPRIVIVRHERNLGASAARNSGIRAGSAPFVAFLDSDDEAFPARLERQLSVFERSGERVGLVYCGAERVLEGGEIIRDIPTNRSDLARVLLTTNVIGGTSVGMVRRCVLDAIGGFDEQLQYTEERDLWLRISQNADVRCIPEVLVRIAQQTRQGRLSWNVEAVSRGREMFCRKHRNALIDHGLLHIYLRESGWWEQRYAQNLREARRFYRASLVARPYALTAYFLLLSACMPLSWLDSVARFKHQIARWFSPVPDGA
jgi:glycosyltransferase involved in cell wall biosynthesis